MSGRRAWAYERGTLWAVELAPKGGPPAALPPPVAPRLPAEFGEILERSAADLAEAMGSASREVVDERLASGRRCFAAWVEGRVAAYCWVSQSREVVGELEREFRFGPEEAYIWDCATVPRYRRQRLYSALLSYIERALHREGLECVWIGTALANRPSWRGFANAGFRPVLQMVYLRFLVLRLTWIRHYAGVPERLEAAARAAVITPGERIWGPLCVRIA